jgi:hypothetical protein
VPRAFFAGLVAFCLSVPMSLVHAAGAPPTRRAAVAKGLEWLARQQAGDGHWRAEGGRPVTMTSLAGMALLMEGSTLHAGKYAVNLRRARNWLLKRAQPDGLIGDPQDRDEAGFYMEGHGHALLFLSCALPGEINPTKRALLEDILVRAARFSDYAQTNRGGWGYVTARDGNGFDDARSTVLNLQALRAARLAGVRVPMDALLRGRQYLNHATDRVGGVVCSIFNGVGGEGIPVLTAASIACAFASDEYNSPPVKRWLVFCRARLPLTVEGLRHADEFAHYYYAQALYRLADDRYEKLFPDARPAERLTWSKYRAVAFPDILRKQARDGHFSCTHAGTLRATAFYLTVLQLEKDHLPIYQRGCWWGPGPRRCAGVP